MTKWKLPLKKHTALPNAYLTHDKKYLIWKDPDKKKWRWGFYVPHTDKYSPQPFLFRTLVDCKFDVLEKINDEPQDEQLWEG